MTRSNTPMRLCIWSGPRNISTALMYSFTQRSDTRVLDEPLYGHYLRVSNAPHPGAEEIMDHMECDGEQVIQNTILGPCDCNILFMKQMAHHLVDLNLDFLQHTTNVLLIRDPVDMLPSLVNQLETPSLRDTGFKKLVDLQEHLIGLGQTPQILDSRELLKDPPGVLQELCNQLAIPFDSAMLNWTAGARPEDGIWAKYWYHSVHKSTTFQPYQPKPDPFPERLRSLLNTCQTYYDRLFQNAIKASA
ncbi:MAG: sulfotransferase family protein [bacterium]|nr:sulfotransferase family protein [bacterium]